MARMDDHLQIEDRPYTAGERQRVHALLDEIRRDREALLARRGGRLFPPAADEIRAAREELDGERP